MTKTKVFILFFKQLWNMDKKYIITVLFQKLAYSFRTILFLYIPKLLIDLIQNKRNNQEIVKVFWIIILLSFTLYIFENIINKVIKTEEVRIATLFQNQFARKMMNIEYSYLEDSKYMDMKEQAKAALNMMDAPRQTAEISAILLESIITMLGIAIVIFNLNPLLLLIMFLIQLSSVIVLIQVQKITKKTMEDLIPINRKYGAMINNLFEIEPQKDIRIYDMSDMLVDNIYNYNEQMMSQFKIMQGKTGFYTGLLTVISYVVSVITVIYAGLRVMSDNYGSRISIGDFTLYTGMATQFSRQMSNFLMNIFQFIRTLHFLIPYQQLMELPEEKSLGNIKIDNIIESIEFKNVSFSYPNSELVILENLSFKINRGEKISIVGLNGAGKTTLVKLICRFFKPSSGEILINNRNIFDYEREGYMKEISAVFQDFKIFNFTIKDNIIAGYNEIDDERINELVEEVGLKEKLETLPNGLDSYIGKAYNSEGIEMSGGQLQKIAIVRALNKDSSLIILDEPTSALDPIAEAEIYENFNNLSKHNTVLYISHRMSSSVFCDKVLLINNGKIEDFDSHSNLMKKTDSLYYKMFKAQSDNYKI